jgi:hypothetical protein
LATADFLRKLVLKTPATTNQEHPVLLYGDCTAPNRTANIVGRGASPEIIILGCTKIPVGMARQVRANPSAFVDSTDTLVNATIGFSLRVSGARRHKAHDDNDLR